VRFGRETGAGGTDRRPHKETPFYHVRESNIRQQLIIKTPYSSNEHCPAET
jgi:hypothetical protein